MRDLDAHTLILYFSTTRLSELRGGAYDEKDPDLSVGRYCCKLPAWICLSKSSSSLLVAKNPYF